MVSKDTPLHRMDMTPVLMNLWSVRMTGKRKTFENILIHKRCPIKAAFLTDLISYCYGWNNCFYKICTLIPKGLSDIIKK